MKNKHDCRTTKLDRTEGSVRGWMCGFNFKERRRNAEIGESCTGTSQLGYQER